MILWILFILAAFIFIMRQQSQTYNYWKNCNIKQRERLDQIKDLLSVFFRRESFFDMMIRLYNIFQNERYEHTTVIMIGLNFSLIIDILEYIKVQYQY